MTATNNAAYSAGAYDALDQLGFKTAGSLSRLSHHIDDIGIGLMAAPFAASVLGHGLSRIRNKKVRSLGKSITKHMGVDSAFGKSHARELLGLMLVAPSINSLVGKGVGKGLGKLPKFPKFGMQLNFNNPQEAAQHAGRRDTVGGVAGFAGGMVGGHLGGLAGTAVGGPIGAVAGGLAGSVAGEQLAAKPAQLAYDVQHDVKQRTGAQFNQTVGQLNQAAGLPAGRRM